MTHLVIGTRGPIDSVNKFIKELSARYPKSRVYDPVLNRMVDGTMEMRVCPIQLWDISFQEMNLDPVLNTCFSSGEGKPINEGLNKFVWGLRKAMKLNPIPQYNRKVFLNMQLPKDTEVIGIGVKEDHWITEDGKRVTRENKTPLSTEGI